MGRASLSYQIRQALAAGRATVRELAEEVGRPENAVRAALSRLKARGIAVSFPGPNGRATWGLQTRPSREGGQ